MTTCGKLILDREGDPTVEVECKFSYSYEFSYGERGSISICTGWELDWITARDADSGRIVELDPHEIEWIARQLEPKITQ